MGPPIWPARRAASRPAPGTAATPGRVLAGDEAIAAGLAAVLDLMADEIDRGPTFPMPPNIISELVRERAADIKASVTRPSATGGAS